MLNLAEGWFSQSGCNEMMTRGSSSENSVHRPLINLNYVHYTYEIGLMECKQPKGLACSADGFGIINMSMLNTPIEWVPSQSVNVHANSFTDVCKIEIENRLFDDSLNEVTSFYSIGTLL